MAHSCLLAEGTGARPAGLFFGKKGHLAFLQFHAGGAAAGAILGRVVVPKSGKAPHRAWAISAIAGAILAVPITMVVMVACAHVPAPHRYWRAARLRPVW